MDAKTKANFINSVAAGEVVPCPTCGAANRPDSAFCISCGAKMAAQSAAASSAPALAPVAEEAPTAPAAPAFAPVAETAPATPDLSAASYEEPASVFADGLPAWDIVPPQVMVRRR